MNNNIISIAAKKIQPNKAITDTNATIKLITTM